MSLYANEKIRVYNPVIGDYEQSTARPQENEELKLFIESGNQLAALKTLPGWQQVELFITESVDTFKSRLLMAKDLDQVRRLQEAILAYSNILHFVDQRINEARSFDINQTPEMGQSKENL